MTRHDDHAVRVLRALTEAWAAALARQNASAVQALLRALDVLEGDLTLARVHPDIVALLEEATQALQADGEERRVAVTGAQTLLERIAALQGRMWGSR